MKYIIVNSVKDGNRYLRKENKGKGKTTVNVKCVNLLQFAKEVVISGRAKQGNLNALDVLDSTSGAVLLWEILKEKSGSDYFVPVESLSLETAQEVWNALLQIRMGAVTEAYTKSDETRILQIKELIVQYEKMLKNKQQYDLPLLYQEAIRLLKEKSVSGKKTQDTFVLTDVCENALTAVEKRFLEEYTSGVYESFSLEEKLDLSQALAGANFFQSYGMANEVKYVLNHIVAKQQALGNTEIFYTSAEYEPYIEAAFSSKGIPYAMINRQNPADNDYLYAMKIVLEWAKNNYAYELLKPAMILSGKYRKTFYKEIRTGIGWGAERYRMHIELCRNEAPEEEEEKAKKQVEKKSFYEAIEKLLDVFSWEEGTEIPYYTIYWRLVEAVRHLLGNRESYKFVSKAIEHCSITLKHMGSGKHMEAVIDTLLREVKKISYDDKETTDTICIRKLDGKLHILEREHVYVLGMSSAHFSGSSVESPVLSDRELELFLDGEKGKVRQVGSSEQEKAKALYQTLASRETEGTLTIGFSSYDTVNLRPASACVPYIRLMELAGVKREEVEKTGYHNPFLTKTRFDETTIWSEWESEENVGQKEDEEVSETLNSPIETWSTTSLQQLLSCPLQFYYQRVLHLPNEDYKQAKPDVWLSASEKGTLAHGIMEDYCNMQFLNKTASEVEPVLQEDLFEAVVEKRIKSSLEVCPYTSKAAYEIESELVKKNCKSYLEKLHKEFSDPANKWMVVACEEDFKDVMINFIGEEDVITLNFCGQMDRLDKYVDDDGVSHYRIMDYKSGSRRTHEEEINDMRSVQHIVYKLALDAMHEGETIVVDQVTFIHFFEDDIQNQDLTYCEADIQEFPLEVHQVVVDVIANNRYKKRVTGDEEREKKNKSCKWCTYKDICREGNGDKS